MDFEFTDDYKVSKKKWITFAGECWRGFKSQHTRNYITHPKVDLDHPIVKYNFRNKVWKKLVKSRSSDDLLVSIVVLFSDYFVFMLYR